jgi:superfamily II DNA or RNA helicase
MNYSFLPKDPNKAYITNNLILPKHGVNLAPVMTALTFVYGEEEVYDEIGELVLVRPAEIHLWQETRHHLIVPREFLHPRQYPQFEFEFVDQRPTEFPEVNIEDRIDFRDEDQRAAFRAMEMNSSGIVNLACGKGKSFLALKLAANLQVPTIIIVNSTALLEQWKLEIEKFLGVGKVGVIQGPTADWGHSIVLAMVHTLSNHRGKWPMAFRRHFGLAIYDECFPEGTLIGDTPIQKVQKGDYVPSYDSNTDCILSKKVVRVFKSRASSLVKVQTANKSVICTPNHPFLTKTGWVRAQHLTNNSMVYHAGENFNWVRVDSVEVLEPGSDGAFGGLCPDGHVYNLEVEDTHTYLANGFVVHNCHHISAPCFVQSADLFFGRRFGLTATAKRLDGLEAIYQYHLGGVIHRNLEQALIPTTFFHQLKWEFNLRNKPLVTDSNGDFNFPRIRSFLGNLDWRNEIIYRDLLIDLQEGRQILVLSHSVEHVDRLKQHFLGSVFRAGTITGETPQDERMGVLRDCNPVIGTFQLAREGLNKPTLDTLYITTPFSSPNDLQQAWGRIQRVYPGKRAPVVRVYEDQALSMCRKSCSSLRSHLKRINYPAQRIEIEVELPDDV